MSEEDKDAEMDSQEEEEEEEERKAFTLDLLIHVKTAQNQNGLRHNDYARYHKYCVRKIYRMRKTLKFTQGRRQYQAKPVTFEAATNVKHLLLLVFKAEANWAYATNIKQRFSKDTAVKQSERSKYHAKKRFQKAYVAAKTLYEIGQQGAVDAYSQIEIEAYYCQMSAVF